MGWELERLIGERWRVSVKRQWPLLTNDWLESTETVAKLISGYFRHTHRGKSEQDDLQNATFSEKSQVQDLSIASFCTAWTIPCGINSHSRVSLANIFASSRTFLVTAFRLLPSSPTPPGLHIH